MNGAHDLGGMHGFGPVDIASGDALFHAEWERRVFALTLACGFQGKWNIDQSRYAREQMEPSEYLRTGYYEHWLFGLLLLLHERGLLSESELESLRAETTTGQAIPAEKVAEILRRGGPADCASEQSPRFQPGDSVRILNNHPVGHTRAPRFVRGRRGVITRYHGSHVLPDRSSTPEGERVGAHLYNVRFEAFELWGDGAQDRSAVYVDVFEPYLENRA